MITTAERLCHLRKNVLDMTQAEFSSAIDISRSNYANIEKGKIGVSQRIIRDICREFGVRKEWLLEGVEPIHEPQTPDKNGGIGALFSKLSANNQKAIESQIQLMLEGQKAPAAAFSGSEGVKNEALSSEEIRLLKEMLAQRTEGTPKNPRGGDS
jgi:transcriptional regulator with XRE-family HTH domain